MKVKLALENGMVFTGKGFGAEGECFGEVVFNTSMTGYQEILTDPSYKGQIVAMTYPLIGNYGVNSEDVESDGVHVSGFVVKEYSKIYSNFRADKSLSEYLKENNIIGVEGIDTRHLTKSIREQGAMKAVISTVDLDDESLVKKAKESQGLEGVDLVKEVTCSESWNFTEEGKYHVVAIDCGIKYNILRCLEDIDAKVTVVPADTSAEDILALNPDGVFISNGPGDPAAVTTTIQTAKDLIGKKPIFGICLGNQMLGQAFGGKTYKLKFGHHGGNHPVKDLKTGHVAITAQNHGFCVDMDSLNQDDVEVTHLNLNDQTVEGIKHKQYPIFSVQFHPEAAPGPHDARYLFDNFAKLMEGVK